MVNDTSLGALEDAQQQESRTARQRIELAEEYLAHYRSRIHMVQESFYELSARHGIQDDPGLRTELQRVSEVADENTRHTGWKIAELEEDHQTMTSQHAEERERFIEHQRKNG